MAMPGYVTVRDGTDADLAKKGEGGNRAAFQGSRLTGAPTCVAILGPRWYTRWSAISCTLESTQSISSDRKSLRRGALTPSWQKDSHLRPVLRKNDM